MLELSAAAVSHVTFVLCWPGPQVWVASTCFFARVHSRRCVTAQSRALETRVPRPHRGPGRMQGRAVHAGWCVHSAPTSRGRGRTRQVRAVRGGRPASACSGSMAGEAADPGCRWGSLSTPAAARQCPCPRQACPLGRMGPPSGCRSRTGVGPRAVGVSGRTAAPEGAPCAPGACGCAGGQRGRGAEPLCLHDKAQPRRGPGSRARVSRRKHRGRGRKLDGTQKPQDLCPHAGPRGLPDRKSVV